MPQPHLHQRLRVALMYGGRSVEHEISIITALQAAEAIDRRKFDVIPVYVAPDGRWFTGECLFDRSTYPAFSGDDAVKKGDVQPVTIIPQPGIGGLTILNSNASIPFDVALCAFHGKYGEDGCVQGLLELADIPYTGCNVLASALSMHKGHCKALLSSYGIPTLPSRLVGRDAAQCGIGTICEAICATPGLQSFPLFVKPCHLGSSIGIAPANNPEELAGALANVFTYDDVAIVESCIENLMEINVSVREGEPPVASVIEVPVATDSVLSYADKYMRAGSKSGSDGMASLTRVIDPQDLDPVLRQTVTDYALQAFDIVGASGVVRFDFIYDLATEELYFNELNPLPGSMSFYLWEKTPTGDDPHLLYTHLLESVIEGACLRKKQDTALEATIGFHALR